MGALYSTTYANEADVHMPCWIKIIVQLSLVVYATFFVVFIVVCVGYTVAIALTLWIYLTALYFFLFTPLVWTWFLLGDCCWDGKKIFGITIVAREEHKSQSEAKKGMNIVFDVFQVFILFLCVAGIHLSLIYYQDPSGDFADDYAFILTGFFGHFIPTWAKLFFSWAWPTNLNFETQFSLGLSVALLGSSKTRTLIMTVQGFYKNTSTAKALKDTAFGGRSAKVAPEPDEPAEPTDAGTATPGVAPTGPYCASPAPEMSIPGPKLRAPVNLDVPPEQPVTDVQPGPVAVSSKDDASSSTVLVATEIKSEPKSTEKSKAESKEAASSQLSGFEDPSASPVPPELANVARDSNGEVAVPVLSVISQL